MSLQREVDAIVAANATKEKEKQRQIEEAENQKKEQERLAQLAIAKAKIPPLLAVLQKCKCQELLQQVWDEIWKHGEIFDRGSLKLEDAGIYATPYPSVDTFKVRDPTHHAEVTLKMEWSYEVDISDTGTATMFKEEYIRIVTSYSGERIVVSASSSKLGERGILNPDSSKIKDFILEDCAIRQKEVDERKQRLEEEKASREEAIKLRAEQEQERERIERDKSFKSFKKYLKLFLLIFLGLPFGCMILWFLAMLYSAM